MHIREATIGDSESVRNVHLGAFPPGEGDLVSGLAVNLLTENVVPEVISIVAEVSQIVVGHVAFSPVYIQGNDNWQGYILAPLGVKPEYQHSGIGAKLVKHGLALLSENGIDAVFVYGDPGYYGKFGFKVEAANRFATPYDLEYPFGWQALIYRELATQVQNIKISCVKSLCDPALW